MVLFRMLKEVCLNTILKIAHKRTHIQLNGKKNQNIVLSSINGWMLPLTDISINLSCTDCD